MKLLVVGGVAGGASAAARMRRLDEKAEIIMFERGRHVSFSNCCLPYYLSGVVENSNSLLLMNPEKFKKMHNIDARVNSEVLSIDRKAHTIQVRDEVTGEVYTETYDKLVLSPGAVPVRPRSIEGIQGEQVFTIRNVDDIVRVKTYLDRKNCKNVAVIGGGFIGIECVENLKKAGKYVSLIEAADQIMMPFDYDIVQTLQKEMYDQGVDMHLSGKVTAITENAVLYEKDGRTYSVDADAVVLAIGVAPETKLAKDAGLEIGKTGAIKVNDVFQTNDPDIYAIGDAIELVNRITGEPGRLALAGPAQKQARAAVNHMCGIAESGNSLSYLGSSCIRIFGLNAACTGLNARAASLAQIPHDFVYVLPQDKVGLMPGSHYMGLKLIFEKPTGKILGAQAIGKGDVVQRINTIAALISKGGTLEDLRDLELCYAPVFGTAKDVDNMAALVGLNVLTGQYQQVPVTEVRKLVEENACIIDVREENEYAAGHLKNAINIPLTQLRQRLDEIDKTKPVYVHCRTSQRSYYAIRCLQGNGFNNIINISGSFLGICLYEYFNDKTTDREPIVTAYNFN